MGEIGIGSNCDYFLDQVNDHIVMRGFNKDFMELICYISTPYIHKICFLNKIQKGEVFFILIIKMEANMQSTLVMKRHSNFNSRLFYLHWGEWTVYPIALMKWCQ